MSRPTEIMLVASATSTPCGSLASFARRSLAAATLSVFSRDVSSRTSRRRRLANGLIGRSDPAALVAVGRELRHDLVLDDPAGAAEFAKRVEVYPVTSEPENPWDR